MRPKDMIRFYEGKKCLGYLEINDPCQNYDPRNGKSCRPSRYEVILDILHDDGETEKVFVMSDLFRPCYTGTATVKIRGKPKLVSNREGEFKTHIEFKDDVCVNRLIYKFKKPRSPLEINLTREIILDKSNVAKMSFIEGVSE